METSLKMVFAHFTGDSSSFLREKYYLLNLLSASPAHENVFSVFDREGCVLVLQFSC